MISEFVAMKTSVTSISLDLTGLYLLSGGQDGTVRIWDIQTKKLVQDLSIEHRMKNDEGVNSIEHHSTKNIFASAGSDSIVKIFQ